MKKIIQANEGKTDRFIRIFIGILALGLGLFGDFGGLKTPFVVIGIMAIFTGVTGFCGLYKLLGINTCPLKKT